MKQITRYIMTLALLITAATGAWATTYTELKVGDVIKVGDKLAPTEDWGVQIDGSGGGFLEENKTYTLKQCKIEDGRYVVSENGDKYALFNDNDADDILGSWTTTATSDGIVVKSYTYERWVLGIHEPSADGPEVTTDAASEQDVFTTASFAMPASDVTVNYTLVRDMQDKTKPVAFSGLPTNDKPIIVKKGSGGKYQPAEALTIQLIDPLAAEDDKNIIDATGLTIKVLVGNGGTPIEYDQENPKTLEAFLADMKPGYYRIKAEPTDENSPYDGTVYSSEFTVVEQYDLTLQPADEYSAGKLDKVIVGSGEEATEITPDATTGEATREGIDPGTEVKLKAKKGYIIEKVETQNSALTYPIALSAVTADYVGSVVCSDGNVYPAKTAAPAGKTAVGILGKVTETGHGLILALKDAEQQNWNTINGWTSETTYAGTTLKLLPDDAARGSLTSYTTLGSTTVSNWAVAQKSDYEAIFTNLGSTTSKTYDGNVNAYITTGIGGTAISGDNWSATEYSDGRAWRCNTYWEDRNKGLQYNVRPVLGF